MRVNHNKYLSVCHTHSLLPEACFRGDRRNLSRPQGFQQMFLDGGSSIKRFKRIAVSLIDFWYGSNMWFSCYGHQKTLFVRFCPSCELDSLLYLSMSVIINSSSARTAFAFKYVSSQIEMKTTVLSAVTFHCLYLNFRVICTYSLPKLSLFMLGSEIFG